MRATGRRQAVHLHETRGAAALLKPTLLVEEGSGAPKSVCEKRRDLTVAFPIRMTVEKLQV